MLLADLNAIHGDRMVPQRGLRMAVPRTFICASRVAADDVALIATQAPILGSDSVPEVSECRGAMFPRSVVDVALVGMLLGRSVAYFLAHRRLRLVLAKSIFKLSTWGLTYKVCLSTFPCNFMQPS